MRYIGRKTLCCMIWLTTVFTTQIAFSGEYLEKESEKKQLVTKYVQKNHTSEALVIDMLVNGTLSPAKAANLPGREIYYFYEAQTYLDRYEQGNAASISKALTSIDKAIAADPASLNYFMKSYLLSKKGDAAKAEEVFQKGIDKGVYKHYLARGSKTFVKMIKESNSTNEFNAFAFFPDVAKLSINNHFLIHTIKKLRTYLKNPSISPQKRVAVYCGMIDFIGDTSKAFYISQDNTVLAITKLLNNLPSESVSPSCKLNFDPDVLKVSNDFRLFDKFKETGNMNHLKNSLYWRNFQTISRSLKTAR